MKCLLLFSTLLLLSGCRISLKPVLGTYTDFHPIPEGKFDNPQEALNNAIEVLKEDGYEVVIDEIFLMVTTQPEDISYQIWKPTNEKWKVSYQVRLTYLVVSEV